MTRCGLATAAIGLALALGVLTAAPAGASDRGEVDVLTVLPDVTPGVPSSVEGLTVGPDGNIYTPTFGFNTKGALTGNAALFVIAPNGKLVRQVAIANSSPHMLGLGFNPVNGFLLILDFGAGKVLNVDPKTGNSSVFIPRADACGNSAGRTCESLVGDVTTDAMRDKYADIGVEFVITNSGGLRDALTCPTTDNPSAGTWYYVLRTYFASWTSANSNQVSVVVTAGSTSTGAIQCTGASNAAETTNAGDNNGYESLPGNACAVDGAVATDASTGTGSVNSCTANTVDKHRFWGYSFGLPATAHNAFLVQVSQSVAGAFPLSPSGIGTPRA